MYIIRKILTYFTVLETATEENSFYYITVIVADRKSVCILFYPKITKCNKTYLIEITETIVLLDNYVFKSDLYHTHAKLVYFSHKSLLCSCPPRLLDSIYQEIKLI
jgi:hypothetical protein